MTPYEAIIEGSKEVDRKWSQVGSEDLSKTQISFPVPETHQRFSEIQRYSLEVGSLSSFSFHDDDLVVIDSHLEQNFSAQQILPLQPHESELKTINRVDALIESIKPRGKRIVAIGGGIVLNVTSYIAEKLRMDLIYFPSTVISMSDSSIGGKVRLNRVEGGKYSKHAYKSFYEPSHIVLDPKFLETLTIDQIQVGLAEVIKHAVYQSKALGDYLLSDTFSPTEDRNTLLKAILWTADLKRICLEIDPEESSDGSHQILRAAHNLSDQIEENSGFALSHGEAVIRAMAQDVSGDSERNQLLNSIYMKLGISAAAAAD